MNSLEFIKQHITEWPIDDEYDSLYLCNGGKVYFRLVCPTTSSKIVDLSEHFAPDYYDGRVWTSEEFEAPTAPARFVPNWDDAPSWATYYGVGVGIGSVHVWYNNDKYMYAHDKRRNEYKFGDDMGKRKIEDVTHYMARPTATVEGIDVTVSSNKYERELTDRQGNSATIDVYDVLQAFNVTCPATQHAVKKLLCTGIRGHKDTTTDLIEARESITRAIELQG